MKAVTLQLCNMEVFLIKKEFRDDFNEAAHEKRTKTPTTFLSR
jgi:hypothetical protein